MNAAPACAFSAQQWNLLNRNFQYYEPTAEPPLSANFHNLIGKRVVLIGDINNNPVHQIAQTEFLNLFATRNACLLVEHLPAASKIQNSDVARFAQLPNTLAIEGFDRRCAQGKSLYIQMMELQHANATAYLEHYNHQYLKASAFAEFLDTFTEQNELTQTHGYVVGNSGTIKKIQRFCQNSRDGMADVSALDATARTLQDFYQTHKEGFLRSVGLLSSSRLLAEAIKKALGKFDTVFVLANTALFIDNREFYNELASHNIPCATLLPMIPPEWPLPSFHNCLEPLETIEVQFVSINTAVRFFSTKLPRVFSYLSPQLFAQNPLQNPESKIFQLADFRSAALEQECLVVREGTKAFLPIRDYYAVSAYASKHYSLTTSRAEADQAFFLSLDHFLFDSGIGVSRVNGSSFKDQKMLYILDGRWHLGFFNDSRAVVLKLNATTNWIDTHFLFHQLQRSRGSYTVLAGKKLNLTDIHKDYIDLIREDHNSLIPTLSNIAPRGYEVSIEGIYDIFIDANASEYEAEVGADITLTALTDLSISLIGLDESIGEKRDQKNNDAEGKRQLTSNVEVDLVTVQTRINELQIQQ